MFFWVRVFSLLCQGRSYALNSRFVIVVADGEGTGNIFGVETKAVGCLGTCCVRKIS